MSVDVDIDDRLDNLFVKISELDKKIGKYAYNLETVIQYERLVQINMMTDLSRFVITAAIFMIIFSLSYKFKLDGVDFFMFNVIGVLASYGVVVIWTSRQRKRAINGLPVLPKWISEHDGKRHEIAQGGVHP